MSFADQRNTLQSEPASVANYEIGRRLCPVCAASLPAPFSVPFCGFFSKISLFPLDFSPDGVIIASMPAPSS